MADYVVYILECSDGTLYTGCTAHLEKRLRQHNSGKGAKYTRSRRPVRIAYRERLRQRAEALRREYQIKRMSRSEKLLLIGGRLSARRQ